MSKAKTAVAAKPVRLAEVQATNEILHRHIAQLQETLLASNKHASDLEALALKQAESALARVPIEQDPLFLENAALRERVADLVGQIARYDGASLLTEGQAAANLEIRTAFDVMNAEQNSIGLFLRNQYAAEIDAGFHRHRTFPEIIISYLTELKALKATRQKPGFFESMFGGGVQ